MQEAVGNGGAELRLGIQVIHPGRVALGQTFSIFRDIKMD